MSGRPSFRGPSSRPALAFTLIELLVVLAIIALLVSLLLPALRAARDTSRGAVCLSNTKQIGIAMAVYAGEHDDALLLLNPEMTGSAPPNHGDANDVWYVALLRGGYLERAVPNAWYASLKGIASLECPAVKAVDGIRPTFTGDIDRTVYQVQWRMAYRNASITWGSPSGYRSTDIRTPSDTPHLGEMAAGMIGNNRWLTPWPDQFNFPWTQPGTWHNEGSSLLFLDAHGESVRRDLIWSGMSTGIRGNDVAYWWPR